jgi:hypothetical protein
MKNILWVVCCSLIFFLAGCSVSSSSSIPSSSETRSSSNTPSGATSATNTQTVPTTFIPTPATTINPEIFNFALIGDTPVEAANFNLKVGQITSLSPNLIIFNGSLEVEGGVNAEINPMVTSIQNSSLFKKTFFGQFSYNAQLNESATPRAGISPSLLNIASLPAGVTDYISLDSGLDNLNYSFILGNSMFIGLDVPGDADLLTSNQLTFLDSRLTYGETKGLEHAFIFFHGPIDCIESTNCDCTTRPDISCKPSALVTVLNNHPIVSATFHGSEYILDWIHTDRTKYTVGSTSLEEQLTPSIAGLTDNPNLVPARVDYSYMDVGSSQGFATVSVKGNSFSVNFYKVGTNNPVWTKTFTKGTSVPPNTSTPNVRPLKYYMADRVINNADFATLAAWGINTAMVDFDVNGKSMDWQAAFVEAAKYNINIVIWPSDWENPRPDCSWEAPFPVSPYGDITKVKPLLDVASQYPNFIGIINGHEPLWTCTNMTFDEMAGLKDQLKAYALAKGRSIKVWTYIDSLYDESMLPASQIPRIMDVAVIWKHCVGDTTERCTGSNSTLARIQDSRSRLTDLGLGGKIELVFVIQTFTSDSPYNMKFTLPQLENTSCEFLHTSALDGFGFYTWDAGWWPDLHDWPDLQPAILYVYDHCVHIAP